MFLLSFPQARTPWVHRYGRHGAWLYVCVFWALLCAAGAGGAQAQPASSPTAPDDGCLTDPECRERYDQAVSLFESGRFETALPEFQAAYKRRQMPWLLINIGRTLHRLGRPKEALDYYDRYKMAESRPDPQTQDRLSKYVAQARALADSMPEVTPAQAAKPQPQLQTPPPAEKQPVYKKWWFWTALGGGVAAAIIIGVTVGAANRSILPDDAPIYRPTF